MSTQATRQILVVDDDAAIRESLAEFLELEGFTTATAENGRVAIERIRDGLKPDAIFLDLMMPEMNGWEFLAARAADSKLSAIPVYVVSAFLELERLQGFEVAGRLGKPIRPNEILDVLDRIRK